MKKLTVVDLFCGCGGATEAFARAVPLLTGKREDEIAQVLAQYLAVNHWADAIATHKHNHPWAEHQCADVRDIKPREAVPSGRVNLLMAGPECTHHSNARGGAPINDQSRITAFTVLDWLDKLYVDCFIIENVPEFMEWGPLNADGSRNKRLRGATFRQYIEQIRAMGYKVTYRVICCADYGDPTSRERLFILGARTGKVPEFPQPTHTDPKKLTSGQMSLFCSQPLKPWRTAREIINNDHRALAKSVFNRDKPLSENTMRRIMRGLERYVLPSLFGDQPMPDMYMVKLRRNSEGESIDEPLDTISAGGNHFFVCEPVLVTAGGPKQQPQPTDRPMPTILTREGWGVMQPFIMGAGGPTGTGRPVGSDRPLKTVLAESRQALAEPWVLSIRGGSDGHLRGAPTGAPLPALTTNNTMALIETNTLQYLAPVSHGKDVDRSHALANPVPCITGVHNMGLVEAEPFLLSIDQTGSQSNQIRPSSEPLATVTTKARLCAVDTNGFFIQYHGSDEGHERVNSLDVPLPVQDTSNRYAYCDPYLVKFYNQGHGDVATVADPLGTITTRDRFALCIPVAYRDGQTGVLLLDILFRMLQPDELAAAHSYRKTFAFINAKGKKASKRTAVKMVGNSWPNETGAALIMALMNR